MASAKNITKNIFRAIADISSNTMIVFSRRSLYEKDILIAQGYKPWQINKTLKDLEKNGYIKNIRNRRNKDSFMLTERGTRRIYEAYLDQISFNHINEKWDRKWRLLIFDIPERIRVVRDVLRAKIQEWDFYKIQHSVFVTPYKCEDELNRLFRILKVQPYVYVMLVDSIPGIDKRLRRHYKL